MGMWYNGDAEVLHFSDAVTTEKAILSLIMRQDGQDMRGNMDNYKDVLTEKQQAVWELKLQGLAKKQIAEKLGISVSMVNTHLNNADRRFQQYENYKALEEKNNEVVDIQLTRGELETIVHALIEYERSMVKKAHYNIKTDWRGRLPFGAEQAQTVSARIQEKLYGQVLYKGLLTESEPPIIHVEDDKQE